jgi:AcrR family transcriptional regulator
MPVEEPLLNAVLDQQSDETEEAVEATAETGTDPAVVAAGAAILLSWHQFFLQENRGTGLFIATWPATILAFASYFEQTEMSDRVKQAT